jgi:hypothetical protein
VLRCDLLTGTVAAEVLQVGKPIPLVVRTLPEGPAACPLCAIAERRLAGVDPTIAGDVPRGEYGPPGRAFAVDNRWKLIDAPPTGNATTPAARGQEVQGAGTVELVMTPRHATSLDGLPDDDATALVTLMLQRQQHLAHAYGSGLAFLSVGLQAGSSLPHVHGQVAGFSWAPPTGESDDTDCPVCADLSRATDVGRRVATGAGWTSYVPWGPATSGELRVALDPGPEGCDSAEDRDPVDLGRRYTEGLVDCLRRLEAAGMHWPYQVVLHPERHAHAHLLPRLDLGMIYPRFVGIMPVTFDHTEYAERLAADD